MILRRRYFGIALLTLVLFACIETKPEPQPQGTPTQPGGTPTPVPVVTPGALEFAHGEDMSTYKVNEPNVKQNVSALPSIVLKAGDLVTISAGGCVQTGGRGRTWKRYVDPSGDNADRLYHGLVQIPGLPRKRIQDVIGQVIPVPSGTGAQALQIGYEDDNYSDNGYYSHDDGTDDQCKDVGSAWIVVVVQHTNVAALTKIRFTTTPSIAGVNGIPTLTTDNLNFTHDTSSPNWSSQTCANKRWLENNPPRYEWTNVYDPQKEYDDPSAGLSGAVVIPEDVARNGGLSGSDVPFTHPFGFDWETFIAPDAAYNNLLAPANTGIVPGKNEATGEYAEARNKAIQFGFSVPKGVMGTETDRGLIPPIYRAHEKDRIALWGRWIVDCGHEDYHSEIHPPLLLVKAQTIPKGSSPDEATGGETSMTYSRVISRPFLVGQEFFDGAMKSHLENEINKLIGVSFIGRSNRIEAHPKVYSNPSSGLHFYSYVVRAPVTLLNPLESSQLVTRFHFTTRTGVAVQVTQENKDSVRVYVVINGDAYKPARLPVRHDQNITFDQIKKWAPELKKKIDLLLIGVDILRFPVGFIISKGILTDLYDAPVAASIHDGEINVSPVDTVGSIQKQFSVDDDQPFPIYGWLSLEWQYVNKTPVATPR